MSESLGVLRGSCTCCRVGIIQNTCTGYMSESRGWGNSIMVSIFICHVGHSGSKPVWSICFRKVKCYQNVINFSPPVPTTGSPKAVHVLSCLYDNACKRSLAICHKSRASCPVSRSLSLYGLHVLTRDVNMTQTKSESKLKGLTLTLSVEEPGIFFVNLKAWYLLCAAWKLNSDLQNM